MTTRMTEQFTFPEGHGREWPGGWIGISNIVTRTRELTPPREGPIDEDPGLRERLMTAIRRRMAGPHLFINDAVIHGIRVRLYTDSHHLNDFWRRNWFEEGDWLALTGNRVPEGPKVEIYAFDGAEEASFVSARSATTLILGNSYYGQLRMCTLQAVARVLAQERGIHLVSASGIEWKQRGALLVGPVGSGASEGGLAMMELDQTRFHSNDRVFMRYGFPAAQGGIVSPIEIRPGSNQDADPVKGYRCFRWLEEHKDRKDVPVVVLSLDDERFEVKVGDLDLDKPKAFAYITEKASYMRSNIVECLPRLTAGFLGARIENAPNLADGRAPKLDSLERLSPGAMEEAVLRLCAFDMTRAMIAASDLVGRERVFQNPLEAMEVKAVLSVKCAPDLDVVLENLSTDRFGSALLGACVAGGDREADYLDGLEKDGKAGGGTWAVLGQRLSSGDEVPEPVRSEYELVGMMRRCVRGYDLNTAFGKDLARYEAALKTANVVSDVLESLPENVRKTLNDFG
jgi:hypothetical protein